MPAPGQFRPVGANFPGELGRQFGNLLQVLFQIMYPVFPVTLGDMSNIFIGFSHRRLFSFY